MSEDKVTAWLALAQVLARRQPETHPAAMCLDGCPCPRHALLALIAAVRAGLGALARHQHKLTDSRGECCAGCLGDWPCPDGNVIAAALLGGTGD